MVVYNDEPDIRFPRRVLGMAIFAMVVTAVFCAALFGGTTQGMVLWAVAGLLFAIVLFAGMLCIAHDRFAKMRTTKDYWIYVANEYRKGRAGRLESVWLGLSGADTDIRDMDRVEADLPEYWKRWTPTGRHEAPRG